MSQVFAQDSVNVRVNVNGCNNNFVCEAVIGEDEVSCPNDCAYVPEPQTPPTQSQTGSRSLAEITLVQISSTDSSINVTWLSSLPVNGSVTWGSTHDYGIGTLREVGYITSHSFTLTGLRSDALYSITITAQDLWGRTVQKTFQVATKKSDKEIAGVTGFFGQKKNNGIVLTWKNPSEQFDYVQIVKSTTFFPRAPYEGKVIYEGGAQSFFDSDVEIGVRYFYTIFVKNKNGFSSGQVFDIMLAKPEDQSWDVGQPITIFGPIFDPSVIGDLPESLMQNTLKVFQNGVEVSRVNNIFKVENLKNVLVTVDKSDNLSEKSELFITYYSSLHMSQSRSYVFTYDDKQKQFITHFGIKNDDDRAPFILYIRNNKEVVGYLGYFDTSSSFVYEDKSHFVKKIVSNDMIVSIMLLILFLFCILILWLLFLRKRRNKLDSTESFEA